MKRKRLNIPTGEIKGQETPKLSKEEAVSAYLSILQLKRNEKNFNYLHHNSSSSDLV